MTGYTLSRGRHQPDHGLYCAMELLAIATDQAFTDHPRGVDNVLCNVVICLNDAARDDPARTRLLLPYVLADPADLSRGPGPLFGTDDGRTKARMRIVFGLRPADQLRSHLTGLARQSDVNRDAWDAANDLVRRLIDPAPPTGRRHRRQAPVTVEHRVPAVHELVPV